MSNQTGFKFWLVPTFLFVLHLVGFMLIINQHYELLAFTPINLIISASLLFYFHRPFNIAFILYLAIVFVSGFLLEWAGVTTGKIFGQYFYGNNLGIKLFDVPIIIGLNWVLLSYSSVSLVNFLFKNSSNYSFMLIALMASAFMVIVDFLMEQVCSNLDFWYWKGSVAPVENYTAWFLFSFSFNYLLVKLIPKHQNLMGVCLYIIQLMFFLGLFVYFY